MNPAPRSHLKSLSDWVGARVGGLAAAERRLIAWTEREQSWLALAAWLAAVVAALGLVGLTGMAPIWTYLNDVIVLLDGGWRIFHDQVPHRDFYSVVGPFPEAILGLGFEVTRGQGIGLPIVLVIYGGALSAVAWYGLRERLSAFWRCAACCWLLFLSCAAMPLGLGEDGLWSFRHATTYAMFYNRLGWSALSLLLLIGLIPRRGGDAAGKTPLASDGVLMGGLLALCVLTKVNFLCAAGTVWAWAVISSSGSRGRLVMWSLVGFGLVAVVLEIYPGGVAYYFADQWTLLQVHRNESFFAALRTRAGGQLGWLAVIAILHAWNTVAVLAATPSQERGAALRLAVNAGVAVAVGLFVTSFNFEGPRLPALVLAGLITVELLRRSGAAVARWERVAVSSVVVLVLVVTHLIADAGSLVYSWGWKRNNATEPAYLPGPILAQVPVPIRYDEPRPLPEIDARIVGRPLEERFTLAAMMTARQFARWVDDGHALLQRHATPSDRIFTTDWANPFNLALGLPPASGGALLWDYKRMTDDQSHPAREGVLREVTLFMVPRVPMWQGQRDFMLRQYGQSLGSEFERVGESTFWVLWRKKAQR